MTLDGSGKGVRSVELLSWNPRVFYHRNFLTESETSTLMASAFNSSTEDTVTSKPFNSNSAWYEDLLKRIARFTQEPPGNYELGIFSKYSVGAEMEARRDWYGRNQEFYFHCCFAHSNRHADPLTSAIIVGSRMMKQNLWVPGAIEWQRY